jgi:hypothetical protein
MYAALLLPSIFEDGPDLNLQTWTIHVCAGSFIQESD